MEDEAPWYPSGNTLDTLNSSITAADEEKATIPGGRRAVLGPLQAAEVQGKTWPVIYSLQSKDVMPGFLENMKSGNEHLA